MTQITLRNDTQSIKLSQDERSIKLSQSVKDIELKAPSTNSIELSQTNSTLNLSQNDYTLNLLQTGLRGLQGEPGDAATISVGTTETGDPGTDAEVTNSGTSSAAILDFVIPKGEQGEKGDTGDGDKNYVMNFTNTDFITVNHNLNKYPAVTVINSANDEVIGDVTYTSLNSLTVLFVGSFSGKVTCN